MAEMITVENLTKKFGGISAVDGITFHVDKGEIFGLLGPNGAGKTTTMRMLSCLLSPTSGSARIGNYDISDKKGTMKIRQMIGLVPDSVGLYETLSAYENLHFFGRMYEVPEQKISENIQKYLKILDIWDRRDNAVASFSKGMKQKVALARALIHDPEVLLMDEPTANLDPEAAKTIRDVILDLKRDGKTMLLNTHNLNEAQRICDTIGILNTKLIAVDRPRNLEDIVSGRQTAINLEEVNDDILRAVRAQNPRSLKSDGTRLIIEMNNPEKETPGLISAIVAAGGKIKSVNEEGATLEDVYLKLVRE